MRTMCAVGQKRILPYLAHLLEYQAKRLPDAPAIFAPERAPLSYDRLYKHVEQTARTLRAMGIGRHDRVAVVLPNGPEMAVAILAVAATASCVPINPAYQAEELDSYFADLRPRALIKQAGVDSPAHRVALSRGIRIIELSSALDAAAGLFTLTGEQVCAPFDELANPDDVAIFLLTSGTTARPKIVPQTHANICASVSSSLAAFALTETDRCINMLPLFHGHALFNTVIASLAAGASVVCTAGYDVNHFFAWLAAFQPTWYSAVPTVHQAILTQARHGRERVPGCRLRVIRSSSAPLPINVLTGLESIFEAPVIECYAMTETTSTLIACNPLPPKQRKPRSVGVPISLDVAIMDEGGTFLTRGQTGQIVVRGAGVMSGYDGDPIATQAAFTGGWFKTGDLGSFDGDGYLFLTGRSREIINRGGEKITPQEVDEVILDHPAVAEAVTFAVPHTTLGEDVASAVVLRPKRAASPKDLRDFVSARLAEFKVPRQILIVSEIPKGPTGKVRRVDLAAKLRLANVGMRPSIFVTPRTPVQELLCTIWSEVLEVDQVGVHDDFFVLGGDSLLATHALESICEKLDVDVEPTCLFEAPTVADMARYLETRINLAQSQRKSPSAPAAIRENRVPASISQERIYQAQQALRGIPILNVQYVLRIMTSVDLGILRQCIAEIVQRHEMLRTTFDVADGVHLQVIAPQSTIHLELDDLQSSPDAKKELIGNRILQDELLHSFDLARGPIFRCRLIHLTEEERFLIFTAHQIICDGWSFGVLVNELTALYDTISSGAKSTLPLLQIQYRDFAVWQRRWQSDLDMVAQLAYWRGQLHNPLPDMRLATARNKPVLAGLRTVREEWRLPPDLSHAVKRFSHREGGTLFMALVSALKILLRSYLGQDDVQVATLVANRNRSGTAGLIGPFTNTVILRTKLAGDPTFREVMQRVRATIIGAFAHQELPFEDIVDTLEWKSSQEAAALSRIMIILHNASLRPIIASGGSFAFEEVNPEMPMPLSTITPADIIFNLRETGNGLEGYCVYKPHVFGVDAIRRLLGRFEGVIQYMVAWPERSISSIQVA